METTSPFLRNKLSSEYISIVVVRVVPSDISHLVSTSTSIHQRLGAHDVSRSPTEVYSLLHHIVTIPGAPLTGRLSLESDQSFFEILSRPACTTRLMALYTRCHSSSRANSASLRIKSESGAPLSSLLVLADKVP